MKVHPDFNAWRALGNVEGMEFVVVGGYALSYHRAPRYTGDIGVRGSRSPESAGRVADALPAFDFGGPEVTAEALQRPEQGIQMGYSPVRVGVLTSISGLSWERGGANRAASSYGGVPVACIGRDDLRANKRASGPAKDLAGIEAVGG